ncbi:MAG TPA: radical SAM protein [Acidimicrobiales bacterium]|nr:radical SAM protein [Acidimicrobiales bacterium]
MATRSVVRDEDQFCVYRSVQGGTTRVLWELTSACNLKCDFCLVEIKGRHLATEVALHTAGELVAAGVGKVLLSGGEPLLHPGAEAVMRRLVDGDVLVKLLTNGTVVNESVFAFIRSTPAVEVSVSVPTADEQEADRVFGRPGSLARIAATLEALPKERCNVICAVSRLNLHAVESVVDWVAAAGVPCLSLTDIFKDPDSPARFRDDCRDLRITTAEVRDLLALVERKREQHAGRLAIRTTQFAAHPGERCMAGRTVFYLDPAGTLLPCTVADNRRWREAVAGMGVREAMDFYRATVDRPPASSCSQRLAIGDVLVLT